MSLPAAAPGATVLVTGATSGIGAELARELGRRGHGLTLVARRRERLEAQAASLRDRFGVEVAVHDADLADDAQRAALLDAVRADGRAVVGLCNDAGVGSLGAFAELDLEHEAHIVRLNVLALHHLTGVLVREMLARRRGAILNLSSVLAFAPSPRTATYAATKAFVLSFSEALHAELLGSGVSCTALCPGPTRTAIFAASGEPRATGLGPDLLWQRPEEVARAGVEGMVAGRRTVVPGVTNKLVAAGGRLVPRTLLLPVAGRLGGDRLVHLVRGEEEER
jgi:short-subunit dehydrogenase